MLWITISSDNLSLHPDIIRCTLRILFDKTLPDNVSMLLNNLRQNKFVHILQTFRRLDHLTLPRIVACLASDIPTGLRLGI